MLEKNLTYLRVKQVLASNNLRSKIGIPRKMTLMPRSRKISPRVRRNNKSLLPYLEVVDTKKQADKDVQTAITNMFCMFGW